MKLSIIIPVLNEEKTVVKTLESLKEQDQNENIEIIVVDAGSTDKTGELSAGYAHVIQSMRGRAEQMNSGARAASADLFLFLHSDCLLESGSLNELLSRMDKGDFIGGCFKLAFSDSDRLLNLIAWGSNLRAGLFKIIFGDQGLFVQRGIFEKIGGFPSIEIMEDWEMSRILKRRGKLCILDKHIYTSPRRFRAGGTIRILWLMLKLKLMYLLKVPPLKIKKYYKDNR